MKKTVTGTIALAVFVLSCNSAFAEHSTAALELLQASAPKGQTVQKPEVPIGRPVLTAYSDSGAQRWAELYKKALSEGRLIIKETDSHGNLLATHQFIASETENKIYLLDIQYQVGSQNTTITHCVTEKDGSKPLWGVQTVNVFENGTKTVLTTEFSEDKPVKNSKAYFNTQSQWRHSPKIVHFLEGEKKFWITHADQASPINP